jgi:RNA polymerase sigma factor (sigma-70 family)
MAREPAALRSATLDTRGLFAALVSRAARMGSRDAEAAAQEALRRSLAHPLSRTAIEYYFDDLAPVGPVPDWSLDQVFAWLHGVLRFVIREESARVSARREQLAANPESVDMRDPSPDQLDTLIDDELRGIVRDCLSTLNADQRAVLMMRAEGLKYEQIASRLGVSGNTVATWVRRGTQAIAQLVRQRMQPRRGVLP